MAYGFCDVPQCNEETFMGWRPKTEKLGRQICENHWNGHKAGTFSLYDAFGFQKPLIKIKPVKLKKYCACGEELLSRHRICGNCAAEREKERKRDYYHRSKEKQAPRIIKLICKETDCENERESNHKYCRLCAKRRRKKLDRERKKESRRTKAG